MRRYIRLEFCVFPSRHGNIHVVIPGDKALVSDRAKQGSVNNGIPEVIIPADPVDFQHDLKQQVFVLFARKLFHGSDYTPFEKAELISDGIDHRARRAMICLVRNRISLKFMAKKRTTAAAEHT